MFRDFLRTSLVLAGVAFVLHYAWESLHLPLYINYGALGGPIPIVLYATAGDVFYTLLAVAVFTLYSRSLISARRVRGFDYLALSLLGLGVAVFVEYKAALLGLWEYAPAMPTILGFGLSPLLQMTVLLPLSVFVSRWVVARVFGRL